MPEIESGDNRSVRERLSEMTVGQRIAYLWDYYKWLVIGMAVAIVVIVVLAQNLYTASHTNTILTVSLLNADTLSSDASELPTRFLETLPDLDGDEIIVFDASLSINPERGDSLSATAYQVLSAQLLGGELDVLVCDETLFSMLLENGAFLPLRAVLSEAELDRFSGELFEGITSGDGGETEVYGLRLSGSALQDGRIYPADSDLVIGITGSSSDPELAAKFLRWIYGG